MSFVKISTAFNIDLEFQVAAFHRRILAYLIDFFMLIIYLITMKSLLYNGFSLSRGGNVGIDIIIISLPMLLYSLVTELLLNGQTIGKKLLGIRVISLTGGEPRLGQYILRWITKFFEWPFFFGYVMFSERALYGYIFITGFFGIAVVILIIATKNNQRLGDLAAGTVVVDTKSTLSVNDTVFMDVAANNYQVQFPEVMRLSDSDINTIKTVINHSKKRNQEDICYRVEAKVKQVLSIQSHLPPTVFLEKLLEDYNFLATKE